MKKIMAGMLLGSVLLGIPVGTCLALEGDAASMEDQSKEYTELKKTLTLERLDTVEMEIASLKQSNKFLSDRLKMLERSFTDLKDKVDRWSRS